MIRIRDIMTREVVSVSPDLCLRDAMDLLSSRHLSGVPVLEGGGVVGVVTGTDLMAFAAGLPGAPVEREVFQDAEEEEDASSEMDEDDVDASGSYFTEMWSDAGADVDVRFANVSGPEWSALDEHTVSEAMTRSPIIKLPPDTPVEAAAAFMKEHGVHRVLVTDGPTLLGLVTVTDVSNAVAEHKLTSRTYVFGKDRRFDNRAW